MTSSRDKGNTQKEIIPSVGEDSFKKMSRGGYDNKYRKLRGISEYTQKKSDELAGLLNERMVNREGGNNGIS